MPAMAPAPAAEAPSAPAPVAAPAPAPAVPAPASPAPDLERRIPAARPLSRNGTTELASRAPASSAPKSAPDLNAYSVDVSATQQLRIPGSSGELKVWIGDPKFAPTPEPGVAHRSESLGERGETAKVEPFALGKIGIEPTQSQCGKIVPSGSSFIFKLLPQESGRFAVGAKVELYDSADCTGSPIPKSARSVVVEVEVCQLCVLLDGLEELLGRAWKAFLEFWDKLLLLVFALLLFLIRKKLYKLFGFKQE